MKKITKFILGSSMLVASTLSFGGGPYNNNNDWSGTPWGQNNSPTNWDSNNMPWSGGNMPWGSDNEFWDRGSSMWRDWDTNKWGGNGMPWGGGNNMPWSKDRKSNKYRNYGRPYGGYGQPYPGGGYGGNPYNTGPGYMPGAVPPPPPLPQY